MWGWEPTEPEAQHGFMHCDTLQGHVKFLGPVLFIRKRRGLDNPQGCLPPSLAHAQSNCSISSLNI